MSGPGGPHVLVVEDDELVCSFLCRALEVAGYRVTGVPTGATALEAVRESGGDLVAILVDGLLPDMHGVELAQRLIVEPLGQRVGICFISGALREGITLSAGVTGLSKPIRRAALTDAVEQLSSWREEAPEDAPARLTALEHLTEQFSIAPR